MAPTSFTTLAQQARSLLSEHLPSAREAQALATRAVLSRRDNDEESDSEQLDDNNGNKYDYDPHQGVTDYKDINNTAIFVVFGIIGAALVCALIWFFFWAKNGGFYFRENDWDDYKSTVLRRRGPNGTLLSGATPTTKLGGGSIYKEYKDVADDGATTITESTGLSGITAGASDIAAREKRERKRRARRSEKSSKKKSSSRHPEAGHIDESGQLIDEEAEREARNYLREYRHERPARVGGMNKQSEASDWDGSTNPADSTVSSSLLQNREGTPTSSPQKTGGGIRKVYSTADRTADRENERIRAEARRLAQRGRSAGVSRRDFSYQRADSNFSESEAGLSRESRIPEESEVGTSSEVGTKSYRHSRNLTSGNEYADEKRRNRKQGYRR